MGRIYAAAQRTIVYLGESDDGSRLLFQHLALSETLMYSDDLSQAPPRVIIHLLNNLFNRPWFSRIWVVQEFLNSRETVFMCGDNTASEATIRYCLYGYVTNIRVIFRFPPQIELYDLHSQRLLRGCENAAQEMYILTAETSRSESKDPRDRLFALTPLVRFQDPQLARLIDYNKIVEDLFEEFSLFLMSRVKLLLLYMIRHPHSANLPSWVPDWSHSILAGHDLMNMPRYFTLINTSEAYCDFSLSQTDHLTLDKSRSLHVLTVKGVKYGQVKEISPDLGIDLKATGEIERESAVIRLLTIMDSIRLGGTSHQWPDQIRSALRKLTREDIFMLLSNGSANLQLNIDDELIWNIVENCQNSVVIVTYDATLAIAPVEVEIGDIVCLIKGTLMPCILREISVGYWKIISGRCTILNFLHEYFQGGLTRLETLLKMIPETAEEFHIY
ncbi:HET-domain-containing protein [Xylariaceae sp. FL0255]|nr:HET-domain-containing protein [Xylariaceae sp. FL0255]